MTEREQWLYGGMAVWAVLNLIVHWWTEDEWEVVPVRNLDRFTNFIATWSHILFLTIISILWVMWKERKDK